MEYIFHEKDGSLCAQHCLNALLQGPYFTAVELAALAVQLDEQERRAFDEHSVDTVQASQNMNESGNFSVQVLSKALEIWSLELVPYLRQSPEAIAARENPIFQHAFICNFQEHWFTIRRFGDQWFNLNSTLSAPRLISPTYLTVYLAQLQYEGHSIFFVTGQLPESDADRMIAVLRHKDCNGQRLTVLQGKRMRRLFATPWCYPVAQDDLDYLKDDANSQTEADYLSNYLKSYPFATCRTPVICPVTQALVYTADEAAGYEGEEFDTTSLPPAVSGFDDNSPELQAIMQQVLQSSRVEEDERQLQKAIELSTYMAKRTP